MSGWIIPSAYMRTPYTETACWPPKRTSIMFMTIDVRRPAMLLRKLGRPHETIFFIMRSEKCGLTKRSASFFDRNGSIESIVVVIIARQLASAAAHIPKPKTARKRNSTVAPKSDMNMLRLMLVLIFPQMRRKLSDANIIVVNGESIAYVLMYMTAWDANSPSAPISAIRRGAAKNNSPPIARPARKIRTIARENILFASSPLPSPSAIDIGTEEPTPMRSAREKFMITKGIARLMAANAVLPRKRPTKTPSSVWYIADASMPMAPGSAAFRKSLPGFVLTKRLCCSMFLIFVFLQFLFKSVRKIRTGIYENS